MAQTDSRLGDMIRDCREKLGLTQEEAAETSSKSDTLRKY